VHQEWSIQLVPMFFSETPHCVCDANHVKKQCEYEKWVEIRTDSVCTEYPARRFFEKTFLARLVSYDDDDDGLSGSSPKALILAKT